MRRLTSLVALLVLACDGRACLYDNDVSYDLSNGLPSVASILSGKWERHSDAYYEQIIRTQSNRDATGSMDGRVFDIPEVGALATAYIHQRDFERVGPLLDGSGNIFVESMATYSVRATAHLALGRFESAKTDLSRSLELAPAGCFRREVYELQLVKYLQAVDADPSLGISQPTFVRAMLVGSSPDGTAATRATDEPLSEMSGTDVRLDEAVTAVSAMIRFGNPQSAQLYAALGDLLSARGEYELAYRSWRRAIESHHPHPQVIQAELDAIRTRVTDGTHLSEGVIDAERRDADRWVAGFRARELELMKAGQDAGDLNNYAGFYKAFGNPRFAEPDMTAILTLQGARFWKPLVLLASILVIFVLMLLRRAREKRAAIATL